GDTTASVSFTAPASNGGYAITGYTVTAYQNGVAVTSVPGSGSPITVSALPNGTAYTFIVTATNAGGAGAASAASAPVTPAAIPGAPTSVTAVAGDTTASVSFTAPASNGGAPITSYTVTAYKPNGTAVTSTIGSSSPITVSGLTNGTAYTFRVT